MCLPLSRLRCSCLVGSEGAGDGLGLNHRLTEEVKHNTHTHTRTHTDTHTHGPLLFSWQRPKSYKHNITTPLLHGGDVKMPRSCPVC